LSISDSLDSFTNTQSTTVLATNCSVAPMTTVDRAQHPLRAAAGMNSLAASSSPCASIMRITVSNIVFLLADQVCDGRCASRKRFSMSAVLICCTWISSKRCTRVLSSEVCSRTTQLPPRSRPL